MSACVRLELPNQNLPCGDLMDVLPRRGAVWRHCWGSRLCLLTRLQFSQLVLVDAQLVINPPRPRMWRHTRQIG